MCHLCAVPSLSPSEQRRNDGPGSGCEDPGPLGPPGPGHSCGWWPKGAPARPRPASRGPLSRVSQGSGSRALLPSDRCRAQGQRPGQSPRQRRSQRPFFQTWGPARMGTPRGPALRGRGREGAARQTLLQKRGGGSPQLQERARRVGGPALLKERGSHTARPGGQEATPAARPGPSRHHSPWRFEGLTSTALCLTGRPTRLVMRLDVLPSRAAGWRTRGALPTPRPTGLAGPAHRGSPARQPGPAQALLSGPASRCRRPRAPLRAGCPPGVHAGPRAASG